MTSKTEAVQEKHCPSCRCFAPRKKRSGGIKRTPADAKWSDAVRERAGWRCQFVGLGSVAPIRCEREYPINIGQIDAAHCFTRGNPRTRTDPDNGLAMCWPHHRAIDADKSLKFFVFRYWLGEERFDALEAKAKARRDR